MRPGLPLIVLIGLTLALSGCCNCVDYLPGEYGYHTFYTDSCKAEKNVSIEVYKDPGDRVTVVESESDNATVTIKTKGAVVMACGVVFSEGKDPQLLTVDIIRRGAFEWESVSPAIIEVALPAGTNYTVSDTGPHDVVTYFPGHGQ